MRLVTNIEKSFQKVTANFTGTTRHDQMGGREYLVAPMIMLIESVCNGARGPALYPEAEIAKFPGAWNNKPVVVYHPQINGKNVSACDPDIITNHGIGVIMNTKWEDKKLKAEAWLEINRMDTVDERILVAIENNQIMELSTGLFLEEEAAEGELNGKTYGSIARNFQPDHLALLPDLKGACSVADGVGFLRVNEAKTEVLLNLNSLGSETKAFVVEDRENLILRLNRVVIGYIKNEMSHGSIRSLLGSLLRVSNDNLWIDEVYEDFFIYEDDAKLYKQDYKVEDNSVNFEGTREEVVRVTEFRTLDGKFVGNRKDNTMDKKKAVDGLIANSSTKWVEADRDVLMTMSEDTLGKLIPVVLVTNEEETNSETGKEANAENKEANAENKEEPAANKTVEQFLNEAPAEIKVVLQSAINRQNAEKVGMITTILANKNCTFTEVFLQTKDVEELANLVALARGDVVSEPNIIRFNYTGQGDGAQNAITSGEPLALPSMVG